VGGHSQEERIIKELKSGKQGLRGREYGVTVSQPLFVYRGLYGRIILVVNVKENFVDLIKNIFQSAVTIMSWR
jgi:hypothetical protein